MTRLLGLGMVNSHRGVRQKFAVLQECPLHVSLRIFSLGIADVISVGQDLEACLRPQGPCRSSGSIYCRTASYSTMRSPRTEDADTFRRRFA